jgi:hypothetical protein
VFAGSCVLFLGACGISSFSLKETSGPAHGDELLNRVERVHVDVVLTKERAHEAHEALSVIVAAGFKGDPVAAHAKLVESLERSEEQAKKLDASVHRMQKTADQVFHAWLTDLESFGNTKLRQRSQTRLAETRARYEAVMNSAVAVQIAVHAFNADVGDHALFLENDFTAEAVALIASEVEGLKARSQELDQRIDACAAAAKAYVESSALRGQLAEPGAEEKGEGKKAEGAR